MVYGTGNILGYNKIGKDMIVNDEQSKTVKFIFELYLKGMELTEIKDKFEWKLDYFNDIIDMNINGCQKLSKLDLYVNDILLRSEQGCGASCS